MKKLFAVLALISMLLLAGCGQASEPSAEAEPTRAEQADATLETNKALPSAATAIAVDHTVARLEEALGSLRETIQHFDQNIGELESVE